MADASEAARLENSGAYVGAVIHRKKKTPPSTSPRARRPMTTFWPRVMVDSTVLIRASGPARNGGMSDLHPHDLVEGTHGLVLQRHHGVRGERRLVAGDHVVGDVLQVPGRRLLREGVGVRLGGLQLVERAGQR